jgi:hypothetical protein
MIFWGQAGIGLPLFYSFMGEGADIGIWAGEPAGGPEEALRQRTADPRPDTLSLCSHRGR